MWVTFPGESVSVACGFALCSVEGISFILFPWSGNFRSSSIADFISSGPTGIKKVVLSVFFDDVRHFYKDGITGVILLYFGDGASGVSGFVY